MVQLVTKADMRRKRRAEVLDNEVRLNLQEETLYVNSTRNIRVLIGRDDIQI